MFSQQICDLKFSIFFLNIFIRTGKNLITGPYLDPVSIHTTNLRIYFNYLKMDDFSHSDFAENFLFETLYDKVCRFDPGNSSCIMTSFPFDGFRQLFFKK